jgi:hypothetical protein
MESSRQRQSNKWHNNDSDYRNTPARDFTASSAIATTS